MSGLRAPVDRGQHCAGKADRQCGIKKGGTAGHSCGSGKPGYKAAQAYTQPDAAAELDCMHSQRHEAAEGETVEVNQRVGGREPGEVAQAQQRRGN